MILGVRFICMKIIMQKIKKGTAAAVPSKFYINYRLDSRNVSRLWTTLTFFYIKVHFLTFFKSFVTVSLDR